MVSCKITRFHFLRSKYHLMYLFTNAINATANVILTWLIHFDPRRMDAEKKILFPSLECLIAQISDLTSIRQSMFWAKHFHLVPNCQWVCVMYTHHLPSLWHVLTDGSQFLGTSVASCGVGCWGGGRPAYQHRQVVVRCSETRGAMLSQVAE